MIGYNHGNNDDANRLNLQTGDAVDIPSTINVNLALADTVRATYNVTRYALSWLASSFIGHDVDCVDIPLPTNSHTTRKRHAQRVRRQGHQFAFDGDGWWS